VRADLHPFHLLYRGEALPVTVVHELPVAVNLIYTVVGETGETVTRGEVPLRLAVQAGAGSASSTVSLPLAPLPNGLYRLDLTLLTDGREAARRSLRFGVLTSRLGRPVSGSIYGANHHEFVASYEVLAAAGIEWSRLWFCREWIEPRQGQWQWHWHDERLAAAREFGIRTIGVLGGIGEPAWTSPRNVPDTWATTHGFPADLAAWEEYVRQVATRYRGHVRIWESWNEIMGAAENGRDGWNIERYVDLHRRTWQVLKAVDPENRLMVSADRLSFVEGCLKVGLGEAFDGVIIHPYRPSAAPEAACANGTVDATGDVGSVFTASRAWLDARRRPDAGVWATEIGWAVSGTEWPTVDIETHGEYLARTFLLAQASGAADNVCWHDLALGMFGICDGQGFPRPALLSFAGLTERLLGAKPIRRLPVDGALQGMLFRRAGTEVLALWSEIGTEFALLTPPGPLRLARYDAFGNRSELVLDATGGALPVTGRVQYLEANGLADLQVARVRPVTVSQETVDLVAGHTVRLQCTLRNVFAEGAAFQVSLAPPPGFTPADPVTLDIARGEQGTAEVVLAARRDAPLGTHAVSLTVSTPSGVPAPLTVHVRVLAPMSVGVEPFDTARIGHEPLRLSVTIANRDDQPLAGEVVLSVPAGMTVTPAVVPFGTLAPAASAPVVARLASVRPARRGDALEAVVRLTDGAQVSLVRSLVPTIADRDGDGLADGWRLNPESRREPGRGNAAKAAIEPGDAEFHCQRIDCTRFTDGWIILHRDNQDPIIQGRQYRITFRARQQGLAGTVGVAVYTIQPWESCGIERHVRIGVDWTDTTTEFTATRNSTNTRFEFYFTETGTLWFEGIRLEDITKAP